MIFDSLTLFGVFAVTAMLVFYELEDRSPWFILVRRSVRSWLGLWVPAGAWPFGVIEAVWTFMAIRRWRTTISAVSK